MYVLLNKNIMNIIYMSSYIIGVVKMEQLLPKLIEGGISIFCVGILAYLLYYIFKTLYKNMESTAKDNKEQTEKFIDSTNKFIDVVKEQNIGVNTKLDKISDKLDDIVNHNNK